MTISNLKFYQDQSELPSDGGPMYAETDLAMYIAEPWNAISSLAIILPAIFWAVKLWGQFRQYSFITFLMPLLFLGGTGSLLYHAFRDSKALLWMDVLPTSIVTLCVGLYFWDKILKNRIQVALVVLPLASLRFILYGLLSGQFAINLYYVVTGILIFFPMITYLIKKRFEFLVPLTLSISALTLSLIFRRIDFSVVEYLPMGSHFLWHIFNGIGAFYLASYLYKIRQSELANDQ